MTLNESQLLLAAVAKMRAAQKAPHRLITYYAPHHREQVEGYEATVDAMLEELLLAPQTPARKEPTP